MHQIDPEYQFAPKMVNGKLEGFDVILNNKQYTPLSDILKMTAITDDLNRIIAWLDEKPSDNNKSLDTSMYAFVRQEGSIAIIDQMSRIHRQVVPLINEQKFKTLCQEYVKEYEKNRQATSFLLLQITPTSKVVNNVEADLLEICEEKCQTSFPTLYKKGKRYYLATYAYHYITINNNGDRALSYPTHIYFLDVKDGTIIARFTLKEFNPFRNPNGGSRVMQDAYVQMLTTKEKLRLWRLLDAIRFNYLQSYEVNAKMYQYYLNNVKSTVSKEFNEFYDDISKI